MLSFPPQKECNIAEWTDDEPDEVVLSHQVSRGAAWKPTPTDEESGDESDLWKEGFGASSADGVTMHMEDATELTRTQLEYLPPVAVARSGSAAGYNSQKPHIMEVFCPPRFSFKSRNYGIYPSLAFDLTIGWDLNDPHVIKFMWKVIEKIQPLMIFGSPNCGSFSVLANLNKNRPNYEAKKAEGIAHLKIVEELYHYQM